MEYKTIMRTTRGTSGHECEEMDELLNKMAADGFLFHSSTHMSEDQERLIFYRERGE